MITFAALLFLIVCAFSQTLFQLVLRVMLLGTALLIVLFYFN